MGSAAAVRGEGACPLLLGRHHDRVKQSIERRLQKGWKIGFPVITHLAGHILQPFCNPAQAVDFFTRPWQKSWPDEQARNRGKNKAVVSMTVLFLCPNT